MLKTTEERMQALTRAVMNEAGSEAEKIKEEARQKAEGIRREAEQKAKTERETIINQARQKASSIKSQNIASARLKAQMLWIERREKLLNQVFETALQRLENTTQWSNYDQIVNRLVKEAVEALGANSARIHADKVTLQMLKDGMLEKITSELKLELEPGNILESGTGIIVETMDGHRQFDNTLETRMERLQDTLRSPIYHILMGESL